MIIGDPSRSPPLVRHLALRKKDKEEDDDTEVVAAESEARNATGDDIDGVDVAAPRLELGECTRPAHDGSTHVFR